MYLSDTNNYIVRFLPFAEIVVDAMYRDNLALFATKKNKKTKKKTLIQVKSLLHTLENAARNIFFYVNSDKTEFLGLKEDDAISTLNYKPL